MHSGAAGTYLSEHSSAHSSSLVNVQISGPGMVWHISFMTVSSTSFMTTEQVVVVVVVVVEAVVVVLGNITGASPGGMTLSGSGMPH